MMAGFIRYSAIALLVVTNFAQASVELRIMGPGGDRRVSLPDGSRLADALLLPDVQAPGYNPCGSISTPALDDQLQTAKQALLARLDTLYYQLVADSQSEMAMAVKQLKQQLDKQLQHGAIRVSLDPDRLRIRQAENLLLSGEYRLYLPSCKPELMLLGAVHSPGPQPLVAGQRLADYLKHDVLQPWADASWAWYLDGRHEAKQIGTDYWNSKHREAAAGAVLFVGFDEDVLPDGYGDINQAIVTALQQGMGTQP
ncbi:capsule biosynthesis GfcC D2 domain-containing protein [Pseudaeromonas sp. ZJS20]|uniref:capsule biosynthesis GfcC D2 domain-containing protein n=1 Tax=Pseudaeromonas aegiceratis TaxID=3153928 RepID=UPI00390CA4D7